MLMRATAGSCCSLWGPSRLICILAVPVYTPTNSEWGLLFLHILFCICYHLISEWQPLGLGWDGIFSFLLVSSPSPQWLMMLNTFESLLSHLYLFVCLFILNYLFTTMVHFPMTLFVFLFFSFFKVLLLLWLSVHYWMLSWQRYSPTLWGRLLTCLQVSLAVQKEALSFWKLHFFSLYMYVYTTVVTRRSEVNLWGSVLSWHVGLGIRLRLCFMIHALTQSAMSPALCRSFVTSWGLICQLLAATLF